MGARPNFIKVAPVIRAMHNHPAAFDQMLVHTGQHYDELMSDVFFRDLEIPAPDVNINIGSGTQAEQTAHAMLGLEPLLSERRPDWLMVYGDVNSTLAAALVGTKLDIQIAHIEAGLRSFDRTMPEEINRMLTDQIATALFTTERTADENLAREGIPSHRCHFVGNVMIDSLAWTLGRASATGRPGTLPPLPERYVLATVHRPSNTDDQQQLQDLMQALDEIAQEIDVIFPIHPRTRQRLQEQGIAAQSPRVHAIEPLGYVDFLNVMSRASAVLTDSGGVQEETTYLGIPCLTIRASTERPVTITDGTNRLVAPERNEIVGAVRAVINEKPVEGKRPELWDGHAAERIVDVLLSLEEARS